MKQLTTEALAQWLQERDRFTILTHRRPDGDTIGSAGALCLGLRALGKKAWVLNNPELTPKYEQFLQNLTKDVPEAGDTMIAVDIAADNRLLLGYGGAVDLLIDHHVSRWDVVPLGRVETDAAACGEIVYDVLQALGVVLSGDMARCLYLAVSTDTGCFRYANTKSRTLRVAAACYETEAELFSINQTMFETVRFPRLQLNAYMIDHLELLRGGAIAICTIPRAVEDRLAFTAFDTEDLSSFLRNIEGVGLSATIRQGADGAAKLSLRAAPGYDCAAVCGHLGGGGHKGAAGATMDLSLAEARAALGDALIREGLL